MSSSLLSDLVEQGVHSFILSPVFDDVTPPPSLKHPMLSINHQFSRNPKFANDISPDAFVVDNK
jgi:hypothetical protein